MMMTVLEDICNTFTKHVAAYEQASLIQQEVGQRLIERLDYLKIAPRYVLDLGCGPGLFTALLKTRYPKASVLGLDLAFAMLGQAKNKQSWRSKWPLVQANMLQLPFASGSIDFIFANQVIHWAESLENLMQELERVLAPEGCLLFSTLGPDTFKELKHAWHTADNHAHSNVFKDMHDVGDALLHAGFLDPVVDRDDLIIHYSNVEHLFKHLKAQGVRNINAKRNPGLTGRLAWTKMKARYQTLCTPESKYPLSYEVIYGHAWKRLTPSLKQKNKEVFIPVTAIKRS